MEKALTLMLSFFKIGLISFGGGYAIIPLIQEQVVDRYGWISQMTFTHIITISQMTPGPLAVNTSTFVGIQVAGVPGALLATAGCVCSGVLLSLLMFRFFQSHSRSLYIQEILKALKASSLGLIISAAATILLLSATGSTLIQLPDQIDWAFLCMFLCAYGCLRIRRSNPIVLMAVTGVAGMLVYR